MEPTTQRIVNILQTTAFVLHNLSRKTITHFEDLSNELLYEIFDFLDFSHIYESFSNLNIRFSNLLLDPILPIKINLTLISKSTFDHYYTNIIIPYQHQIRLTYLSNPFINKILFSSTFIQLELTRLETLILDNVIFEYFGEVFNHLISLSSLTINCVNYIINKNTLYRQIFRLPVLKYCSLSFKESIKSDFLPVAITEFSPIEHLVIKTSCHSNGLNALLSYVPQLRRLSLPQLTFHEEEIKSYSFILNHLTHVSINVQNILFEEFEPIIRNCFQQLQVLHISINNDPVYLDSIRWQRLILSHMPYLRIFDFIFDSDFNGTEDLTELMARMHQFNSSFWLERQYCFEYHVDNYEWCGKFYFHTTNLYRGKRHSLSCAEYKKLGQNDKKLDPKSVKHVTVFDEEAMIACAEYFPNVTRLSICHRFIDESENFLSINLNRIFPLEQITKLFIEYHVGLFPTLISLIRHTPNIHTIEINTVSIDESYIALMEHSRNFQFISKTNNIRTMIIKGNYSLKITKFLMNLCPRLQHLKIKEPIDVIEPLLRYILSKTNANTRHLFSICINNIYDNDIETLKNFIKSENLFDADLMKVTRAWSKNIHLWR